MKRIAVFASGGGTDFQSIVDSNACERFCEIACLIASKDGIGAIDRAKKYGIPVKICTDFGNADKLYGQLADYLIKNKIDFLILTGWLKIIPESFISQFRDRIINIHPSLIPSFCGAGYYGLKVHRAVLEYGVKVTGCTVHFVDEVPDGGAIIAQKAVEVKSDDTPEILQMRVLKEEHKLLPECVRLLCEGKILKNGRIVSILGKNLINTEKSNEDEEKSACKRIRQDGNS